MRLPCQEDQPARREPRLEHSCPAQLGAKAFRVSGTYHGFPVDATFTSDACGFEPGQGGAQGDWSFLMTGAGPGIRKSKLGSAPVDGVRRRKLLRRAEELRRAVRRLTRKRLAALADGTLQPPPGGPPDELARKILRDQLEVENMPDRPFPGEARVYSTTRRRTGSVGGTRGLKSGPDEPVYVVVVRFAYRDYAGRRHVDETALAATLEARTLETTDVAWGAPWNPSGLGRPIELQL